MILVCDICGYRGTDVHAGVVAWVDPAQPYASIDRCTDHAACRARVIEAGEEWPVRETLTRRETDMYDRRRVAG